MTVLVIRTPEELHIEHSGSWGLVPTMGALHPGHLTLIARAAAENDAAMVSVFVNPSQFGSVDDLVRYPRELEADIAKAESAGAGIIYAPEVSTVYPPGFSTWIDPGALGERWEGRSRPGHFRGVATVVSILMNSVRPDRSYFGEKDFQQLQIIRRVHQDLRLPGAIIGSPTVRDHDGLALSSRNARLSAAGRALARLIPQSLAHMADLARAGNLESAELERAGRGVLDHPELRVDYVAVVDANTLEPVQVVSNNCRILVAVVVEGVRLIDNISVAPLQFPQTGHRST